MMIRNNFSNLAGYTDEEVIHILVTIGIRTYSGGRGRTEFCFSSFRDDLRTRLKSAARFSDVTIKKKVQEIREWTDILRDYPRKSTVPGTHPTKTG